jgi:hypothetical protein
VGVDLKFFIIHRLAVFLRRAILNDDPELETRERVARIVSNASSNPAKDAESGARVNQFDLVALDVGLRCLSLAGVLALILIDPKDEERQGNDGDCGHSRGNPSEAFAYSQQVEETQD